MTLQRIVSFGYYHPDTPKDSTPGAVVVDVRSLFHNPYRVKHLRTKSGQDAEVQALILQTPNFAAKYAHVKQTVTSPGVEVAYIGCHGGRHRSVFLAERLGQELGVEVEHRDLDR